MLVDPVWAPRVLGPQDLRVLGPKGPTRGLSTRGLLTANEENARQLLVRLGLWNQHENLEVIRTNMPTAFSAELEGLAAELAAAPPPDVDYEVRLELVHLRALAIDDESTQEVDDAISVEQLPDGRVKLWVHVADPSRYISPGDALDMEARKRGSSAYLPTGTVPMFPLVLAAGPFSLRPGLRSSALSVCAPINADGSIDMKELTIGPSTIVPERLSDGQVNDLLASDTKLADKEQIDLIDVLRVAERVANLRQGWRRARGSIESLTEDYDELPDMDVNVSRLEGGDEWVVQVIAKSGGIARGIVKEAMLFAGEAVAQYGSTRGLPLPYQSQARKDPSEQSLASSGSGFAGKHN